jgi:hypothetical protein
LGLALWRELLVNCYGFGEEKEDELAGVLVS